MDKKINVLFVCIANSCRSQMAEALFNKFIDSHDVNAFATSAGTSPSESVNVSALEVLKELNIEHQSVPKLLSSEMMQEADFIISMGCMSSDFCPVNYMPKTQDWNIDDPVSHPIEKFREVRDIIKEKVDILLQELSKSEE
ncbi:MAG: low molecular weight phosphatase family protein [Chloroflexi bacterium]|nr:low molecular weight phosphatase family protein [Chloroflexota bacterium]|tara:strand:+ start:7715 stop:8137 length:423 start_codon:yes stop_codon:yes gene_type:complete